MNNQDKLLETCKRTIETKLGWGSSELWTNQDYDKLSQRILDATGVNLSAATLKRIWGKIRYESKPAVTTLDTLARFAGHDSWRQFGLQVLGAQAVAFEDPVTERPSDNRFFTKSFAFLVIGILVIATALIFYAFTRNNPTETNETFDRSQFAFSSKKVVSEGVPNSVIFDYDASQVEDDDTVIIQQSWDPRLRTRVSKDDRQHTSIYYHPGFFQAKLVINNEVVREHTLFIKTNGWLPMVDVKPVPVYFKEKDVRHDGTLSLPLETLTSTNIAMQPLPPWTCFYYVDDFGALKSDSLVLEARVRNDFDS